MSLHTPRCPHCGKLLPHAFVKSAGAALMGSTSGKSKSRPSEQAQLAAFARWGKAEIGKNLMEQPKEGRGGKREGAGRKPKPDADQWGNLTVSLKKETIAQLRELARSIYVGEALQAHIDRYPLPTLDEYKAATLEKEVMSMARKEAQDIFQGNLQLSDLSEEERYYVEPILKKQMQLASLDLP